MSGTRKPWVYGAVALLAILGGVYAWRCGKEKERQDQEAFARGAFEIPYASTRRHFMNGVLQPGRDPYGYSIVGAMPGLTNGVAPAKDIVVVLHGLNNTDNKAVDRFCLARESLQHNRYDGAVVGFSWDGSTNWDPFGATGYYEAKHNAKANGKKLARFCYDLAKANPGAGVRLIGYSMGAMVALEAAYELDQDPKTAPRDYRIESVHLVGASIDNEKLEMTERYGKAVERKVVLLFNYYSPDDSKLLKYFTALEFDRALGRHDVEHLEHAPGNYRSRDVSFELREIDSTGAIRRGGKRGTNHSSYLGIRDDSGRWLDDRAINVVAEDITTMRQHRPRPTPAGTER